MQWSTALAAVWEKFLVFLPLLAVLAGIAVSLAVARRGLLLRPEMDPDRRFAGQLAMLGITGVSIVIAILALPVDTATRGQLLSLLGLVLTAMIALSSTTFVANAMGGLMLRALDNFRAGDFVKVDGQFGRVTERGLFHTEIQSEDRDLTTIPNLVFVTNPVTVIRESGTIVSTTLSLGYEIAHTQVEPLLVAAATDSGLEDSFVQILELQDHSVVYRVAGFLRDVKRILSARSHLRAYVLDSLHAAGIEIVSPTFMNQRRVDEQRFVPAPPSTAVAAARQAQESSGPEALVFDKAERAERIDGLRSDLSSLEEEQAGLVKQRGNEEEPAQLRSDERVQELERRIVAIRSQIETLTRHDED